jgi:Fic family protein
MLFEEPTLDSQEREVLQRIEDLKRQLVIRIQAPVVWHGLLRRVTLARAVRGSNSIEGYNVTLDDAIAAAEGDEPLEASDVAWAAVRGYQDALTYVLQLSGDVHFKYSVDVVRSLHYMMMRHEFNKWPGRWRPGAIHVVDEESQEVVYDGPDSSLIPELMDELMHALNTNRDASGIVLAAMAHLNLVMIHPFRDGNGRMGRCLQTLVIARSGTLAPPFCSIEEYLGSNTPAYYSVLAEVGGGVWNPRQDTRPWIRFCLTAHFRQATSTLGRMENIERLWDGIDSLVTGLGLPDRTLLALVDAAMLLKVRNVTYRSAAEISAQVASRDLKALCDAGLLNAFGENRGRFYTAADPVTELRRRLWATHRVGDPFGESSRVITAHPRP